jgi:two-component system sensor kinase FixL
VTLALSVDRHPLVSRRRLTLGVAYLAAYFALNAITDHHSLAGSAVTLWSPDNALSVMLIMESWTFAPLVLLAQIGADYIFGHAQHGLAVVCSETTLAASYLALALVLRRGFGVRVAEMQPKDLVAVMALTPIGAALTGLIYCSALVLLGQLPASAFLPTFAGFWIGDTAAMGVLIPATGAVARLWVAKPWRRRAAFADVFFVAIALLFLVTVIFLSADNLADRFLFNLAYLPILLVGLRFGRDTGALTLLFVQTMLLIALDYFHQPDTNYLKYQVSMFILSVSGLAIGATVDEWQETAAQLRRRQVELAKVSERATNSMIAAAMSHEISQPLASIAAYVVSARRLLEAGTHGDRALAALRRAESEAGRAREIVERLRDFVAKGDVAREPLDLAEIVARVVALQADAARERGVLLVFDPRGPAPARGDRVALEQAIGNLVVNAIEAVPERTGRVRASIERGDGRIRVKVEDNGPGVSPAIAERLFDPFETTKPRGMGLGLPLAQEIAMRHGGGLSFSQVAPHGACFTLETPLA